MLCFGLEYIVFDDIMVFVSYLQGFKLGIFNLCVIINELGVNFEVVDLYEFGVKSDVIESFCVNVILFVYDYKDCQYIGIEGGSDDLIVLEQCLCNVVEMVVKGLEVELIYVVIDNLILIVVYGFIDFEIKKNDVVLLLIGLVSILENMLNMVVIYYFDIDMGLFMFNVNYYYCDDYLLFEISDFI